MGYELAIAVGTAVANFASKAYGYVVPSNHTGQLNDRDVGDPILNKMDPRLLQYAKELTESRAKGRELPPPLSTGSQERLKMLRAAMREEKEARNPRQTNRYYEDDSCRAPNRTPGSRIVPKLNSPCITVAEAIPDSSYCGRTILMRTALSRNVDCAGGLHWGVPCHKQTIGYCKTDRDYTFSTTNCYVGGRVTSSCDYAYLTRPHSEVTEQYLGSNTRAVEIGLLPRIDEGDPYWILQAETYRNAIGVNDASAICNILKDRCKDLAAIDKSVAISNGAACPSGQHSELYVKTYFDGTTQNLFGCFDNPTTQPPTTEPTTEATTQAPTNATITESITQATTVTTTQPTTQPTTQASTQPTTQATTVATTQPTTQASTQPTTVVTTQQTTQPTTLAPTDPTVDPSTNPTAEPTSEPTTQPTIEPTTESTSEPTSKPTSEPTNSTLAPSTLATTEEPFTDSEGTVWYTPATNFINPPKDGGDDAGIAGGATVGTFALLAAGLAIGGGVAIARKIKKDTAPVLPPVSMSMIDGEPVVTIHDIKELKEEDETDLAPADYEEADNTKSKVEPYAIVQLPTTVVPEEALYAPATDAPKAAPTEVTYEEVGPGLTRVRIETTEV